MCTALLGGVLAWAPATVAAQFAMVPTPLPAPAQVSAAASEQDYRHDGAKHLYATYPMRVYKGRLPPFLHGVAVVETEVDADGQVLAIHVRRPPAAPEVMPWIRQMIMRAAPFPVPAKLGKTAYVDVWLVHKGGRFQLDTLTEGQD